MPSCTFNGAKFIGAGCLQRRLGAETNLPRPSAWQPFALLLITDELASHGMVSDYATTIMAVISWRERSLESAAGRRPDLVYRVQGARAGQ